ncbi:MAG: aromatic ring-hydroxylating dioxygenase subunit alpha [Myxococcota bacterium]
MSPTRSRSRTTGLASVPHAVERPEAIPAARYADPAFFALEAERLWPRVWQMACRLEEIPELGDYVEYEILGQSVIVVRTGPERIEAFHNACRHRGMRLVQGRGNARSGFVCPFHGWCWNPDGSNRFVFAENLFRADQLRSEDLRLRRCRVDTWGGCAFINFDDAAPPLRDCLEPFATYHDAHRVEKMRAEAWLSCILPVNWKLACEAFMEGYHATQTHPQLLARSIKRGYGAGTDTVGFTDPDDVVGSSIYFMQVLSEGMGGGMIHARDIAVAEDLKAMRLPADPMQAIVEWNTRLNDEIVRRALAEGIPMPDLNQLVATGHVSSVNYCFPHFFLLPVYGNAAAYRVRPLGPEETLFEIWTTTLMPEDVDHVPPRAPTRMAWDDPRWPDVVRQDFANLPRQQAGLRSPGFEFMRLSGEVEGLISNYHRVIDGFLAGRSHAELLPNLQQVSGGIDAPIRPIVWKGERAAARGPAKPRRPAKVEARAGNGTRPRAGAKARAKPKSEAGRSAKKQAKARAKATVGAKAKGRAKARPTASRRRR